MKSIVKAVIATVVGLSLSAAAQAGPHGHAVGHGRGPVGHGNLARGNVARGRVGAYNLRWHGRFSHRHWDGRYRRWLYFNPALRGWYCYSPTTTEWVVVENDVPAPPAADAADE